MHFVEFISPVRRAPRSVLCLCALYFLKHELNIEVATIAQVKGLLTRARLLNARSHKQSWNVSRAINALAEKVDSPSKGMWQITPSGEKEVKELLDLPTESVDLENDTSSLEGQLITKINDELVRDYLQEAIDCLGIGRLRAAVVFLWVGAVHALRKALFENSLASINSSAQKFDSKARKLKKLEDCEYIRDGLMLLMLEDLGRLDKAERDMLEECLKLRNKCGHPGKYSPGPKRVEAFIEDLVSIVFSP